MNQNKVLVCGVGMTKFQRPGTHEYDYTDLGHLAIERALRDANLDYCKHVDEMYAGYVYGDSVCGQRIAYMLGRSGIPIYNLNNNSGTGGSAIYLARQAIAAGQTECALVLGFEKMHPGSHQVLWDDRALPTQQFEDRYKQLNKTNRSRAPLYVRMWALAGSHLLQRGLSMDNLVKVAEKNRAHGLSNPYALQQKQATKQQILHSPMVNFPLSLLQCSQYADGAACVVMCNEKFALDHRLLSQSVEVKGIALTTDTDKTFKGDILDLIGMDLMRRATDKALEEARVLIQQVDVIELTDSFTTGEIAAYLALGLCSSLEYVKSSIESNRFRLGGAGPIVNPSGGLLSLGQPISASGVAQCVELCWQLRGMAEQRQVRNCKIGLQQSLGMGGSCVVAVYQRYRPDDNGKPRLDQTANLHRLEEIEKKEKQTRAKL